ncbi:MAG TPA: hypothetical protein VI407_08695 [Erythrobacter sp.]
MAETFEDSTEDRLYLKALSIRHERGVGLWLPIMQHLALRGHAEAMVELADWFSGADRVSEIGRACDATTPAGLYRRAYRKGYAIAARNMAISCFNGGDMAGYRRWLRKAARAGDAESGQELRYFETRLWHGAARKVRRIRPVQKRDGVFLR